MKKKFIFTKDSSFIHIKDAMYQSATEHIIQDEQTKKLYHIVVSYGSSFNISKDSVFMSHLLGQLGIRGFAKAYIADDCEFVLPWYPHQFKTTRKVLVELPENVEPKDIKLGSSYYGYDYKKEFLSKLFGFSLYPLVTIQKQEKIYSLCTIIRSRVFDKYHRQEFVEYVKQLKVAKDSELYEILKKFSQIDIKSAIECFESETKESFSILYKELKFRQSTIQQKLSKACEDSYTK